MYSLPISYNFTNNTNKSFSISCFGDPTSIFLEPSTFSCSLGSNPGVLKILPSSQSSQPGELSFSFNLYNTWYEANEILIFDEAGKLNYMVNYDPSSFNNIAYLALPPTGFNSTDIVISIDTVTYPNISYEVNITINYCPSSLNTVWIPMNSVFSNTGTIACGDISQCPVNENITLVNNVCTCSNTGEVLNNCNCQSGRVDEKGDCVCSYTYESVNGLCVCPQDYLITTNNQCVCIPCNGDANCETGSSCVNSCCLTSYPEIQP